VFAVNLTNPPGKQYVGVMVAGGGVAMTTAVDLATLVPQEFVAVTLMLPFVADALKFAVTEFPLPLKVTPVPLYDQL
jgi:hypothetical protein